METIQKILKKPITATFIAIILGFLVAAGALAVAGYDPVAAFTALFQGIFSKPSTSPTPSSRPRPSSSRASRSPSRSRPACCNIGAEGEYIAGTMCAVLVGAKLNLPAPIQIPVVILAGVAGGALIGAITGFLKSRFGIHEVITAIMLNWTMLYLNHFVVRPRPTTSPTPPPAFR